MADAKRRPPNAGKGRVKGTPNKVTKALKEMILGALEDAGGQTYLAQQAVESPAAFMTLVGKVLPMQVNTQGDLTINLIERRIVRSSDRDR